MRPLEITLSALFASLTAAGAYIVVPLWPVPITLQTFFLYLAIALFGLRIALLSQMIYVTMGLAGLPVFAGGKAGASVFLGPTAGYIFGFLLAALVGGLLIKKVDILPSLLSSTVVIYLSGYLYLVIWLHMVKGEAMLQAVYYAFTIGVLPFIFGDLLKMLLASYIASSSRVKSVVDRLNL